MLRPTPMKLNQTLRCLLLLALAPACGGQDLGPGDAGDELGEGALAAASASCGSYAGRVVDRRGVFLRIIERYRRPDGQVAYAEGLRFMSSGVPGISGDQAFTARLGLNSRGADVSGMTLGSTLTYSMVWNRFCRERPEGNGWNGEPAGGGDHRERAVGVLFTYALNEARSNAWDVSLRTLLLGPSSANPTGQVPSPPHDRVAARFGEIDLRSTRWDPSLAPLGL